MSYYIVLFNSKTGQFRDYRTLYYTKKEAMQRARKANPGFDVFSIERVAWY